MSEFLKPCPFCGSEQIYIYLKNVNYNKWVTVCGTCLAKGGIGETRSEAAALWNTRMKGG